MKTREMARRIRDLAWPSPPADLRDRVIEAALRELEAPAIGRIHPAPMGESPVLRRPIWRTAPVVLVVVTFLMVGGCAGLDMWAQRDLDIEIARLEAKYGSFDPATSLPPAVPDADNRARVVRSAATFVAPIPGERYHYLPFPMPSPVPDDLRAFADANRDAIGRLGDLRTRQQSNWEIDRRKGRFPEESVGTLFTAVYVTALIDIEDGRSDDAGRVISAGLGISASFRQEPDLVAQRLRFNSLGLFDVIRRLITDSEPSAPVLKDLAWWLAEDQGPSMSATLLAEMKWTNAMFARMEQGDIDPSVVDALYPITWPGWPSAFVRPAAVIGRPFVRMARLRSLRQAETVLESLVGPRPRPALQYPSTPEPWALVDRLALHFTAEMWGYGNFGDDFASALAAEELGVALRRFKLGHSEYPVQLSALVPDYLDRVPIDPYTGLPPIYVRRGSGFTLQASGSIPELRKYLPLEWDVKK